ncbi:MAG: bacteriohemerythrin [Anaerolineaceae bacterium]
MASFKWTEEYSVGIRLFDDHHKALIGYINDLQEAMQVGKGKDALGTILGNLIDYTKKHFKAEEALFTKWNYPGYPAHLKEHEKLTATVLDLQTKYAAGQAALSVSTITFLKDWLIHHILETDKMYGPFLNKMGEK